MDLSSSITDKRGPPQFEFTGGGAGETKLEDILIIPSFPFRLRTVNSCPGGHQMHVWARGWRDGCVEEWTDRMSPRFWI